MKGWWSHGTSLQQRGSAILLRIWKFCINCWSFHIQRIMLSHKSKLVFWYQNPQSVIHEAITVARTPKKSFCLSSSTEEEVQEDGLMKMYFQHSFCRCRFKLCFSFEPSHRVYCPNSYWGGRPGSRYHALLRNGTSRKKKIRNKKDFIWAVVACAVTWVMKC